MTLTIEVPEEVVGPVKDKMPPARVLEAVALNAVLDFLLKLEGEDA